MTGYLRNGYCEVPASDAGNHSVAAEVTDEFLKFSAEQGNDLRTIGLKGGCKWCLCVTRWKEAFDARGKQGDKVVPKYDDDLGSVCSIVVADSFSQDLFECYQREGSELGDFGRLEEVCRRQGVSSASEPIQTRDHDNRAAFCRRHVWVIRFISTRQYLPLAFHAT